MAPDMSISMRHTKLKASEAALLAGELKKPSWESRNEGIHERVSFEDSIWGFDLAGGSFYKTPLRVTAVKPDSRAEKAGIRPGDKLKRINGIQTETLTIQEAHEIIIASGIHLQLAVTAPEDEEDAYFCYEDPLDTNGYDSDEERRLQKEKEAKRPVHAKVSSYWSLQWPWVSKRRVIYRESNCFMVPSKFESKHSDRFSPRPFLRVEDDIVLHNAQSENEYLTNKDAQNETNPSKKSTVNGNTIQNSNPNTMNGHANEMTNGYVNNENVSPVDEKHEEIPTTGLHNGNGVDKYDEDSNMSQIDDFDSSEYVDEKTNSLVEEVHSNEIENNTNTPMEDESIIEDNFNSNTEELASHTEELTESILEEQSSQAEDKSESEIDRTTSHNDEVINGLLNDNEDIIGEEQDKLLDSILSEDDSTVDNSAPLIDN